jgi:hypothetical protein
MPMGKKFGLNNWGEVLTSLKEMKKQSKEFGYKDKRANLAILLSGKSDTFIPKDNYVPDLLDVGSNRTIYILKNLENKLPEDENFGDFIDYLITGQLIGSNDLIQNWTNILKKKVDIEATTAINEGEIKTTRIFMKNLVTLSMESWYINQNIAGILRKCSKASGIKLDEIEQIVKYHEDTSSSMRSNITKIKEYINISKNNPLNTTNKFIKYCQESYRAENLFKVETFPKTITDFNEKANDNNKIDTIIDVLMEPYSSSIKDFKMFYVLQNNKTKLKCYDQLRTFSMFTNFINKVIPTK